MTYAETPDGRSTFCSAFSSRRVTTFCQSLGDIQTSCGVRVPSVTAGVVANAAAGVVPAAGIAEGREGAAGSILPVGPSRFLYMYNEWLT